MARFLKSRFFIIALLLAIVLVTVPSVLAIMGQGSVVRNALNVIATPFRFVITKTAESFEGFAMYFREFDDMHEENKALRAKLKELEEKVAKSDAIREENEWLYDYLGLSRQHPDYLLETATVVGREAGNYMTVMTLDCGSAKGIEVNMPVITDDGIVGYVSEVGLTWCKVATLIETATSVGAYVERSGEIGVVKGDYTLKNQGYCQMSYLSAESDIKVGDRIVSSGIGVVYPRGLLIGTVAEIVPDEASRTLSARIEPAVDLKDISRVMIVKDFAGYTEEPAETSK